MRIRIALATVAAACLAAASARATIIFQTDFEAPAYTTGALGGQNGWSTFGAAAGTAVTVDSAAPISGLQSARVNGSLVTGQTGPFHTDASAIPKITLSADILLTSGQTQRSWQFSAIGAGLINFSGGINIGNNGDIFAITNGFPVLGNFSRDAVHRVDILLDYGAQTFGVRLDGSTLASGLAFCGGNAGCQNTPSVGYFNMLFDTFGTGGDDFGYLDNVLVQSTPTVPEPSTWAMMLLGFGGLGAMLRRRRLVAA